MSNPCGNNRGQPLTAVDINTPIKERLRSRDPKVKYGSDDGEDNTPPKTRIVTKTAAKRKKSNAKSSNATKKPTVAKRRRGAWSRGKGSRPSCQGKKNNMTKEGSAAIKKGLKDKRKYGKLIKSLCKKKKAKAPASLSKEFPQIKICKDVAEWAANKETKECVGMIVHNHPAFMKWMGKTDFYTFNHLMKRLGFTPKHKKWHWDLGGHGKKEVKEGRKGMLWYHPTFGPNSSDTDITTNDRVRSY